MLENKITKNLLESYDLIDNLTVYNLRSMLETLEQDIVAIDEGKQRIPFDHNNTLLDRIIINGYVNAIKLVLQYIEPAKNEKPDNIVFADARKFPFNNLSFSFSTE